MGKHDLKLTSLSQSIETYRSAETFTTLYERTHLIVFRYIYALHGEPQEDVEDLWLETYAKAWRSRHRFSGGEDAALGWLLRIARNLVIDRQRQRQRHPLVEVPDAEAFPSRSDDAPENIV
ncbi:MAG: RNA polymerase sigma factor, partial [Anaerolineae bacterium]|nr:RNA polymerase sigma factor [Anaerolineae bacterium]